MRVTVTGGAGFVGHHLVRALVERGDEVVVLDSARRFGFDRPGLDGAERVQADIRNLLACRSAFEGSEAVVHLAAQSNVMGSHEDPDYCFSTNVLGTWNVLEGARAAAVRHLVFSSSREVYGDPPALPVREDAPLRAKNAYGASKVAGEALLAARPAGSPDVSVLRLANVIGSGDRGRVVPLWVTAARAGQPLVIFGGAQEIDFVPVGTVVGCVLRLLERGPVEGAINVGGGRRTSLPALAERIRAAVGSSSPIEVHPPRGPEVTAFEADVTRMRSLLGVEPPEDPLADLAAYGEV